MYTKPIILCLIGVLIVIPAFAADSDDSTQKLMESCARNGDDPSAAVHCERRILDKLKQAMQAIYEKSKADARLSDEEAKQSGSKALGHTEKTVIQSQKSFDTYMENECSRQVSHVMEGTYGADVQVKCEMSLVKGRIQALSESYP